MQVCRSRILLGKCAEAGNCWACVRKQGIAEQLSGCTVLPGKCAEAGYCWASVQKQGIAG